MRFYVMLADAVAILHAVFIAFVVFGFVLILIGARAGWSWVRRFWFRLLHLLAISYVGVATAVGEPCPLTILEDRLREAGGGAGYGRDFVGFWLDRLIFYDFPVWLFAVVYAALALAIAATFVAVPPRRG
jgi:hypothetical protein